MLRKLRTRAATAVAVGAAVVTLTAAPAYATSGAVVGVVTGAVAMSGLSVNCAAATYNFGTTVVSGAFAAGSQAAAGTIALTPPVFWTTGTVLPGALGCPAGQENVLSGKGTVNAFPFALAGGVGTVTGGCDSGTYSRVGGVVLVELTCTVTVNGTTAKMSVLVPGVLFFDNPHENGVTVPYYDADFAGLLLGANVDGN